MYLYPRCLPPAPPHAPPPRPVLPRTHNMRSAQLCAHNNMSVGTSRLFPPPPRQPPGAKVCKLHACRGEGRQGGSMTTPARACCTLKGLWRCRACLSSCSMRGAGYAGRSVMCPCSWPQCPSLLPASISCISRYCSPSCLLSTFGSTPLRSGVVLLKTDLPEVQLIMS